MSDRYVPSGQTMAVMGWVPEPGEPGYREADSRQLAADSSEGSRPRTADSSEMPLRREGDWVPNGDESGVCCRGSLDLSVQDGKLMLSGFLHARAELPLRVLAPLLGRLGVELVTKTQAEADRDQARHADGLPCVSAEDVAWKSGSCVELDPPEFDYGGCLAIGVGGRHSEAYGDDGVWVCHWCGARPRWPVAACERDTLWIRLFPQAAPHGTTCGCPECVPCLHHPGVDCSCWCRYMGCSPRNCGGEEGSS